jgi:hypothetical protein
LWWRLDEKQGYAYFDGHLKRYFTSYEEVIGRKLILTFDRYGLERMGDNFRSISPHMGYAVKHEVVSETDDQYILCWIVSPWDNSA